MLYVAGAVAAVDEDDVADGVPRVTLSEMLDDLHIADATGADAAAMME